MASLSNHGKLPAFATNPMRLSKVGNWPSCCSFQCPFTSESRRLVLLSCIVSQFVSASFSLLFAGPFLPCTGSRTLARVTLEQFSRYPDLRVFHGLINFATTPQSPRGSKQNGTQVGQDLNLGLAVGATVATTCVSTTPPTRLAALPHSGLSKVEKPRRGGLKCLT
ncbi:hypothetical protein IWX90DRAFT_109805 [Phyllosticta citrichinensis]|uniref:Uncharacterized protein n=1 Tax=Phyllosticta citrichinensis TaxID=1130410 RepID=A0ABR1Y2P4_9PEZI